MRPSEAAGRGWVAARLFIRGQLARTEDRQRAPEKDAHIMGGGAVQD